MSLFNFLSFSAVRRQTSAERTGFNQAVQESLKLSDEAMGVLKDVHFSVERNNKVKAERAEHLKKLKEEHDLEVAKKGSGAEHPSVGAEQEGA